MDGAIKSLQHYRRIVVKIGSSLLVDLENGLHKDWLQALSEDIAELRSKNVEVLLVSSGAIALGRSVLHFEAGTLKLEESQACAAIGQIELAKAYADALGQLKIKTGQILLTVSDTEERRRYLNARATMETLLRLGVVPVINENDTIATQEIRYGDNDRLAARVATMVCADLLIILSDIDGLYTAPPHLNKEARFLSFIPMISAEIEAMAGCAASHLSRGGMRTKLEAGKIANAAGTAMIIASGKKLHPLKAIDKEKRFSFFAANERPVNAWKTWISGQLAPVASLIIDEGARKALLAGKSLLPAGVLRIDGEFSRGDTVAILNERGREIARGLVAYDKSDAEKIIGLKKEEVEKILPFSMRSAFVHRNDMVVRNYKTKSEENSGS